MIYRCGYLRFCQVAVLVSQGNAEERGVAVGWAAIAAKIALKIAETGLRLPNCGKKIVATTGKNAVSITFGLRAR